MDFKNKFTKLFTLIDKQGNWFLFEDKDFNNVDVRIEENKVMLAIDPTRGMWDAISTFLHGGISISPMEVDMELWEESAGADLWLVFTFKYEEDEKDFLSFVDELEIVPLQKRMGWE